jgi:nucleoside diphosphate kinase
MERTYLMVKPDGVQRSLIGEIVGRFERKGLKLVGYSLLLRPDRSSPWCGKAIMPSNSHVF